MSVELARVALTEYIQDAEALRDVVAVWPDIEAALDALSTANTLPIFGYVGPTLVYRSPIDSSPDYCRLLLEHPTFSAGCLSNSAVRAEASGEAGATVSCHAGLLVSKRSIEIGFGAELIILAGGRRSPDLVDHARQEALHERIGLESPEIAAKLRVAALQPVLESSMVAGSLLLDTVAILIHRLLSAAVGVYSLTVNAAHELSKTLVGLGGLGTELGLLMNEVVDISEETRGRIASIQRHLVRESGLGLFVVRNYLSNASEHRYRQAVLMNFEVVRVDQLLIEMIDLYDREATKKRIRFKVDRLDDIPAVVGIEMELRRLLHNVLDNAIKYSYRSVPNASRVIRVGIRNPYDPGFKQERFAIRISNFGLGLGADERGSALKAGFRGQQAIREVPVGAGIGLSEVSKIMKVHGGHVRIDSEKVHGDAEGDTYLTTVELVFPYSARSRR